MNSSIQNNINDFKERDLYSLSLFCLYKLIGIPEYSSLSELAYVLNKDNFLNLCEYFGGQTITIPTLDDLSNLIYSLLLYQYVQIEKMDYQEAVDLIRHESRDLRKIKAGYFKLVEVLKDYSFNLRDE